MESKDKRPILTANCTHCGKQVKFYVPDKPGVLKFTCKNPECGNVFGVNVPKELIDKINPDKTQKQENKPVEKEGNQTDEGTVVEDSPKVKDTSKEEGPKTEVIFHGGGGATLANSRICSIIKKKRGLFDSTKIFPLKRGENIIGRKDHDIHSDIEIDDSTISRRSITITVEEKGNSYKYRFKVNKCTNPVYVNGVIKELNIEYYIDPGAKITLGKTTLELKMSAL